MSEVVSQVECSSHTGENCNSYCLDCDCMVCLPCILSPECHQGHKCTSLKEVTSERKSQAISQLEQLKDQAVIFTHAITELKQNQEELESDGKTVLEHIDKRAENLHLELNQLQEELSTKLKEFLERENTALKANIEMLESESCKLKSLISFIEGQQHGDSSTKISDVSSIVYYSSFLKPIRSSYLMKRPFFDTEVNYSLKDMFGRLQLDTEDDDNPELSSTDKDLEAETAESEVGLECTMTCIEEVEEKSENKRNAETLRKSYGTSTVQRLHVYSSVEDEMELPDSQKMQQSKGRSLKRAFLIQNRAIMEMNVRLRAGEDNTMWLTGYGSRDIRQIRMDGSQVKRFQTAFDINDFTLNSKQELFVTEKHGKNIRKFNKSFFSYKWIRFTGFPDIYTTTGICCAKYNNLLVCLQRHLLGGKIVKISETGTQLLDIEFGTDGNPLFKWPRLVIQNPFNENICVIDDKSVVVVKDNTEIHFSVNGDTFQGFPDGKQSAYSTRVVPEGIDVDQRGHLYISDYGNGRVCEYNTDGQFVKVVKDTVYQVTGLAVDTSGYLWISGACGNLFVTEIKTDTSNM